MAKTVVVVLAVAFACLLITVPAYAAGFNYQEYLAERQGGEQAVEDLRKARAIEDLITALPEDAGLADKQAIERARAAYDSATQGAKSRVSTSLVRKLEEAESRLELETRLSKMTPIERLSYELGNGNGPVVLVLFLWLILYEVQTFLAYGTAYRKAKGGGDNGVSLFGWLLLYGLAAAVPFLGIYLWRRHRAESKEQVSS